MVRRRGTGVRKATGAKTNLPVNHEESEDKDVVVIDDEHSQLPQTKASQLNRRRLTRRQSKTPVKCNPKTPQKAVVTARTSVPTPPNSKSFNG